MMEEQGRGKWPCLRVAVPKAALRLSPFACLSAFLLALRLSFPSFVFLSFHSCLHSCCIIYLFFPPFRLLCVLSSPLSSPPFSCLYLFAFLACCVSFSISLFSHLLPCLLPCSTFYPSIPFPPSLSPYLFTFTSFVQFFLSHFIPISSVSPLVFFFLHFFLSPSAQPFLLIPSSFQTSSNLLFAHSPFAFFFLPPPPRLSLPLYFPPVVSTARCDPTLR